MENIITKGTNNNISEGFEGFITQNWKSVCVMTAIYVLHDLGSKAIDKGIPLHFKVNKETIEFNIGNQKID